MPAKPSTFARLQTYLLEDSVCKRFLGCKRVCSPSLHAGDVCLDPAALAHSREQLDLIDAGSERNADGGHALFEPKDAVVCTALDSPHSIAANCLAAGWQPFHSYAPCIPSMCRAAFIAASRKFHACDACASAGFITVSSAVALCLVMRTGAARLSQLRLLGLPAPRRRDNGARQPQY